MILGGLIDSLTGANKSARLKGTVVLMRKNVLDLTDFGATIMDGIGDFLGKGVTCQLISSTLVDHDNGGRGKVGAEAELEQWVTSLPSLTTGESKFGLTFDWEVEKLGVPGAIIVNNYHSSEFLLKTVTLHDVPGRGNLSFVANSWIYPAASYTYSRVFFANDVSYFGQYPYAGFLPNRPTVSRRRMPEPGTKEYAELERDPERAFIHTITSQIQTIIGISLLEVLSKHSSDELYLGQRDTPEWTSDPKALEVFKRFSERLVEIESKVVGMNHDPQLLNRNGPAKFPYMLLYPNTSDHKGAAAGLTAKGIPNSISI